MESLKNPETWPLHSFVRLFPEGQGSSERNTGLAVRVLWPSIDYDNYIQEGWEGSFYYKYIPSLGTYETFVIKENSDEG